MKLNQPIKGRRSFSVYSLINFPEKEKIFREVLTEIESSTDIGKDSWILPQNATVSQQAKDEICQKVIRYKRDKERTRYRKIS